MTRSRYQMMLHANVFGADTREHVLGKFYQHGERNAFIQLQCEDAIRARLLSSILQIFANRHGSPPWPLLRNAKSPGSAIFHIPPVAPHGLDGMRPASAAPARHSLGFQVFLEAKAAPFTT